MGDGDETYSGRRKGHDGGRDCGAAGPAPQQPAAAAEVSTAPPVPATVALAGGGGLSTRSFVTYAAIGFGVTFSTIAAIALLVWLYRRRRRAARPAPTLPPQGSAPELLLPGKKAPQPFLVVHPGGDADVAFKDLEVGDESDEELGIKAAYLGACSRTCRFCIAAAQRHRQRAAAEGEEGGEPACGCEQSSASGGVPQPGHGTGGAAAAAGGPATREGGAGEHIIVQQQQQPSLLRGEGDPTAAATDVLPRA